MAATVNLASERASVEVVPGVAERAALIAAVERAGYRAREAVSEDWETLERDAERRSLFRAAVVALALGWSMFFALQVNRWANLQWDRDSPLRRSVRGSHTSAAVVGPGHLPRRVAGGAPRHQRHEHADHARRRRCLHLQRRGDVRGGTHRRRGPDARHLLRHGADHRGVRDPGPLSGGAGQGAYVRRDQTAAESAPHYGARRPRRRGGRGPGGGAPQRRPAGDPPRREVPGRRRSGRRAQHRGRVYAHRREPAGGEGPGRARVPAPRSTGPGGCASGRRRWAARPFWRRSSS